MNKISNIISDLTAGEMEYKFKITYLENEVQSLKRLIIEIGLGKEALETVYPLEYDGLNAERRRLYFDQLFQKARIEIYKNLK